MSSSQPDVTQEQIDKRIAERCDEIEALLRDRQYARVIIRYDPLPKWRPGRDSPPPPRQYGVVYLSFEDGVCIRDEVKKRMEARGFRCTATIYNEWLGSLGTNQYAELTIVRSDMLATVQLLEEMGIPTRDPQKI